MTHLDSSGEPIRALAGAVDADVFFATEWSTTAKRIASMLARHGVARSDSDDIVQETALRLFRTWRRFDHGRGVDSYARVIALNVLRDELRRPNRRRELVISPAEVASSGDCVERGALARLEVTRVGRALRELNAGERRVLTEIVDEAFAGPGQPGGPSAATRMARMRARRRLVAALGSSAAPRPRVASLPGARTSQSGLAKSS